MANSTVMKNMSMERIRKAFEKAKSETTIPKGVRLELIAEEHYDMALDFARDNFIRDEPINKSLNMEWSEEIKNMWLKTLQFNLSLMLVDEKTGEMIAIRTVRIDNADDMYDPNSVKSRSQMEALQYACHCDKLSDFFGHFGITEAFHFIALSVNNKYTRRGFATIIFNAAINMVRHFGIDPVYIKGEGSSNFAKKLFERAGFEVLYDLPYDNWIVDGRRPIQNTGEHKSMTVYGLKVPQNRQ